MGLLLAQYEFQRAKQRVNVLQAKGLRLNNLQERYQKRIGDIQKEYGKKENRINSNFSQMQSRLSSQLSGAAGMQNASVMSSVFGGLGVPITASQIDHDVRVVTAATESARQGDTDQTSQTYTYNISAKASAFSTVASQLQSLLTSILDALKEAELEKLEMANAALEQPIVEKDNEIAAEVATNETMLSFQKERRDAAKAAVDDAVKNSVAHFGLGG